MGDSGDLPRTAIDLFIAAYLFVAWCWRHPPGTAGHTLTAPLAGFVRWIGLGQNWSMFSPNPATASADLEVIIRRQSGAALVWTPPRLETLSRWRAFLWFRHRAHANAIMSGWAVAGRDTLASYLLRRHEFGDDPPAEVLYCWVERPMPAPGVSDPPPPPVRTVFHVAPVPPERR
jgi:hypothetical protein